MRFERKCPRCNETQRFTTRQGVWIAKKRNSLCNSCAQLEIRIAHSKRMVGENHPMYGKHHSEETKQKMRLAAQGRISPNKGKVFSKEIREKMRIARIEYLKTKPNGVFISKSATVFLDELEKLIGKKIEREFELDGRFFDGKIENLLIEVDCPYWHSHLDRIAIDKQKNNIAERNGYKLKRFIISNEKDIPIILHKIILENSNGRNSRTSNGRNLVGFIEK